MNEQSECGRSQFHEIWEQWQDWFRRTDYRILLTVEHCTLRRGARLMAEVDLSDHDSSALSY